MLKVTELVGFGVGGCPRMTLYDAITEVGLNNSTLKLCVDAGDILSYPGSQLWVDRSGNQNFYLGSGSSVDSADPTFNGILGDLESYFSYDGADCFTCVVNNPTWYNSLHYGTPQYGIVYAIRPAAGLNTILADYSGWSCNVGGRLHQYGSPGYTSHLSLGTGSCNYNVNSWDSESNTSKINANDPWIFGAISIDVVNNVGKFFCNGSRITVTPYPYTTYSDPVTITYQNTSSSTSANYLRIGMAGDGGGGYIYDQAGTRIAYVGAWYGVAPTDEQIIGIFNRTRCRYGV